MAIAPSPAAAAPEPGLTVDPQSPAGVEYQIPLDTGRGHGSGKRRNRGVIAGATSGSGGGANGSAGVSAPVLFGSGITPENGSGSGKKGKGSKAGGRGGAGATGEGGSAPRSIAPVTASANYSPTAPIAALVGAIVLAGLGLGLFLRRRNRPRRIFS